MWVWCVSLSLSLSLSLCVCLCVCVCMYIHTYTEKVDAGIVLVLPQRLQCDADGRNGRLHEHLDERVLLGAHALALCAFVVGTYLLVPWGENGEAFAKLDLFQRTQLAELPPHKAVIQRHLFLPKETCFFARRGPISCKRDLLVSKKTYHLTKAYHGQNKKNINKKERPATAQMHHTTARPEW